MLNSLLSKINSYLPFKDLLNYIFKKALGNYIDTNNLNIDNMEKEISKNSFISLNNLKLNSSFINHTHLSSSPIKVLKGNINETMCYLIIITTETKGRIFNKTA